MESVKENFVVYEVSGPVNIDYDYDLDCIYHLEKGKWYYPSYQKERIGPTYVSPKGEIYECERVDEYGWVEIFEYHDKYIAYDYKNKTGLEVELLKPFQFRETLYVMNEDEKLICLCKKEGYSSFYDDCDCYDDCDDDCDCDNKRVWYAFNKFGKLVPLHKIDGMINSNNELVKEEVFHYKDGAWYGINSKDELIGPENRLLAFDKVLAD